MENIWENDWRPESMINFGAQNDPEIGPLRPIFNAPLKIAQIDKYTKTDVNPVKTFWENDQRPEFSLILGPKVIQKLGLWGADILNTSKSTCNEHVKQYWCVTSENILRKWPNTRIFTYFGAQNDPEIEPLRPILYTSLKSSSKEHIKHDWCETRGNFLTKYSKSWILLHLEAQNG